jgi:hypothetical protein
VFELYAEIRNDLVQGFRDRLDQVFTDVQQLRMLEIYVESPTFGISGWGGLTRRRFRSAT